MTCFFISRKFCRVWLANVNWDVICKGGLCGLLLCGGIVFFFNKRNACKIKIAHILSFKDNSKITAAPSHPLWLKILKNERFLFSGRNTGIKIFAHIQIFWDNSILSPPSPHLLSLKDIICVNFIPMEGKSVTVSY